MGDQLGRDLASMTGVWHDHLEAFDPDGTPIVHDEHGGVPGPFPYDNLVYFDFDGSTVTQTNVTFAGREPKVRTFESDLVDGVLRFRRLGPEAPQHVGVSGGPGVIWFVPESWNEPGLNRYSEPDHIRIEGESRWRTTVLYRNGPLVRTMMVTGTRLSGETSERHHLDPRGPGSPVHEDRDVTTHFVADRAGYDSSTTAGSTTDSSATDSSATDSSATDSSKTDKGQQ